MGKEETVNFVRDFHRRSDTTRISPNGKEFTQVTAKRKPKGFVYEIKEDSVHRFRIGQIITESKYNSVKEKYDIRMKCWDGNSQHLGNGVLHISGRKRELIKDFLDKRKYNVKELEYHYHVTGNGKKVAWRAMSMEIQEMKTVKFLYIRVVGESGYDRASRALGLD